MDKSQEIEHSHHERTRQDVQMTYGEELLCENQQCYSNSEDYWNRKDLNEELIAELRPRIEDIYIDRQRQIKKECQKRLKDFKTRYNQSVKLDAHAQIEEILRIRKKELSKFYKNKLKEETQRLEIECEKKFHLKLENQKKKTQAELHSILKTKELIESQLSQLNTNKKESSSIKNTLKSQLDEPKHTEDQPDNLQDLSQALSSEPQTSFYETFHNDSFGHEEELPQFKELSINSPPPSYDWISSLVSANTQELLKSRKLLLDEY